MSHEERIHQLMHSANNCRQMLGAIDRKLNDALDCLDHKDPEECRELLAQLKQALPQAITLLQHGK